MDKIIRDHSVVGFECELRSGHIGQPVTHKGVDCLLIRYLPQCEHLIEPMTLQEAEQCLKENRPDDQDS
jgi:hypothetical protein